MFIIRALLSRHASSEVQFGRSSRMETALGCRRNRCHISSFLRYDMIVLLVIFVDTLGGSVRGLGARHGVRRRNANGSEASREVFRMVRMAFRFMSRPKRPCSGLSVRGFRKSQILCAVSICKRANEGMTSSDTNRHKAWKRRRNRRLCSFTRGWGS